MGQPVGEPALVQAELTFQVAEDCAVFCIAMAALAVVHLALCTLRREHRRPKDVSLASWSLFLCSRGWRSTGWC